MAVSVSPGALPAPKKNSHYQLVLTASGGTAPYTWAITSGALPGFLTLSRLNDTQALVSGKVPATLNAATFTATITATDSLSATGTCVSTGVTQGVDGPDATGYHGTEANRTTVTTVDQFEHGSGLTVADALQRMWPLTGPSQNS
jgi:hypothetical protein